MFFNFIKKYFNFYKISAKIKKILDMCKILIDLNKLDLVSEILSGIPYPIVVCVKIEKEKQSYNEAFFPGCFSI